MAMPARDRQLHLHWGPPNGVDAPRFAEFFAGIGLVRMGLEAAGWRIGWANDIDADKRAMYDHHFGDADRHFALADVHTVDPARIPDIGLATASFPCTDLSLAGGRHGLKGKQSSAFWGFLNAIRGMGERRPPLVMLENVPGFLTSHQGRDFEAAMLALNEIGYAVDPFILDAKWFVPQSRPRLFIVGTRIDAQRKHDAEPAMLDVGRLEDSRIRPAAIRRFIAEHPNINWSIRDLPEPPAAARQSLEDIHERLSDDAREWWSRERADYLYGQFSERHRAVADAMIARRRWSYATVFRRVRTQADGTKRSMGELRTDGIAGCLRTPKGGSARQILFKAGYGEHHARLLTPRECARLMGADDFAIHVGDTQALFGFGDAVCVPAITWIAQHYLNPLLAAARGESGKRQAAEALIVALRTSASQPAASPCR